MTSVTDAVTSINSQTLDKQLPTASVALRQPLGNLSRSCVALHGPAISVARTGSVTRRRRALATRPPFRCVSLSRPAPKAAAGNPSDPRGVYLSRCPSRSRCSGSSERRRSRSPQPLPSPPFSCPRRRDRDPINELADAITPHRRRRRQQLLPRPPAAGATGRGFKKAAGAPVQDEAHVLPHGQGRAAREAAGARVRGELLRLLRIQIHASRTPWMASIDAWPWPC